MTHPYAFPGSKWFVTVWLVALLVINPFSAPSSVKNSLIALIVIKFLVLESSVDFKE